MASIGHTNPSGLASAATTARPFVTMHCGYRRHGKDELGKALVHRDSPFKWVLLGKDSSILPRAGFPPQDSCGLKGLQLVAFAAQLKRDTLVWLRLRVPHWEDLEPVKDSLRVPHPTNPEDVRLLRDWYIDYGGQMRAVDLNYWCQRGLDAFTAKHDNNVHQQQCGHPVVTDWRFLNEMKYALDNFSADHVQSIRVFHAGAPIPPDNIESEHSLDKYETDFLALPSISHLSKALEHFPQYAKHIVLPYSHLLPACLQEPYGQESSV